MVRSSSLAIALLIVACSGDGSGPDGVDGGSGSGTDAGSGSGSDAGSGPDGGSNGLTSTLTSSCATLQGRAIVNYNSNLGIAFTEDDIPYTSLGSVSFELPAGFSGNVPNPEAWDGSSPRKVVAMTTASFQTHGNHCWLQTTPPSPGSVTIHEWRPNDGVVRATFNALALKSCTGSTVCTISGTIETTGEGVFD
ncbi:MAG: hypothetical protein SFX73_39700 [Kofleriaceae bacterium]|nr:hypothetical protein [Kofleriaceae bacterium]